MDFFGDDKIARLLRLKRYEQPPPRYFENFLQEFHRRQRDQLRRQSRWSIWVDRARDFVFRHNVRSLASYAEGIAAAVACAAVISITIYQQPDTTEFAVGSSRVPSTAPANAEREFNRAPPAMARTFNAEPILLPRSRDVLVLPVDALPSDEFVPLKLEWESPDDQSPLEK